MFNHFITYCVLFAFILVAIFGIGASMLISDHVVMPDCPLQNGQTTICLIDTFAHLSSWQSMFATVVPILLILGLILLAVLIAREFLHFNTTASPRQQIPNTTSIIPQALFSAFSQGILHSKLCA